jgi:hypothetical protein
MASETITKAKIERRGFLKALGLAAAPAPRRPALWLMRRYHPPPLPRAKATGPRPVTRKRTM